MTTRSPFVVIDLETRSACDLRAHGGHLYAEHPTTRLLTVAWSVDGEDHVWLPGVRTIDEGMRKTHLPDVVVHLGGDFPCIPTDRPWVGHNAFGFDELVWRRLAPASHQPPRWIDSACLALAAGLPGGLQHVAERLWGEGKYAEGSQAMKRASRATSIDDCEASDVPVGVAVLVARYNVQDVRLTRDLMSHLNDTLHLPGTELHVLEAHRRVNNRGVRVDAGLVSALYRLSNEAVDDAVAEIRELTGGELATLDALRSRPKVIAWLERQGATDGLTIREGGKRKVSLRREVVNQMLAMYAVADNEAPVGRDDQDAGDDETDSALPDLTLACRVLQLRQAAMRITAGKLVAAGNRVDHDGVARALFAYWGAHCVSGDTEVLTRDGWVPIEQWDGGDIAQWERSGDVRFLPAEANAFQTDEPTVVLAGPYASGRFTLGHTVPTLNTVGKHVDRKAGEMAKVGLAQLPVSGVLRGSGTITPEQMRVLVAVQADGHWVTDTRRGRGLQFTFRKQRKIHRIKELLTAAGVPYRVQEFPSCPGQFRVSVRWKDCPPWLCPERKRFGVWLLDSMEEARSAFVDEVRHWDGHDAGPGANVTYYSTEEVNRDWVKTLCHLTGRAARQGSRLGVCVRNTDTTQSRPGYWTPAPPLETVYCPTTRTGYWLYRHNGLIGVTGNTGRWAGRGIQVQNLPRAKEGVPVWPLVREYQRAGTLSLPQVRKYLEAEQRRRGLRRAATVDDAASALIRSLFVPHAGDECLLTADLAAIEARVLNWLAGSQWMVDIFAAGGDPYVAFCHRVTGETIKKKDPRRQVWKVILLGAGYQLGADKLAVYAAAQGVDLSVAGLTPQMAIDAYRDAHPEIAGTVAGTFDDGRKWRTGGFWNELNAAAVAVVSGEAAEVRVGYLRFYKAHGHMYVVLPSGRELCYRNARITQVNKWGKDRPQVVYASPRWRNTALYGGKLAENVTQAVASDFIREALVAMEAARIRVVLHVHDEIVASGCRSQLPEFMHLITRVPTWAPGFPLEAEGGWVPRYAKSPPKGKTWTEQVWRNGARVK